MPTTASPGPTAALQPSSSETSCVDDHTASFLPLEAHGSGSNGASSRVRYSFQMFRFTSGPAELYLHCSVRLCEQDDRRSCVPASCRSGRSAPRSGEARSSLSCSPPQSCNAVRKREALRELPGRGLLSYGPIRVETPDPPESSELLLRSPPPSCPGSAFHVFFVPDVLAAVVLPVAGVWTLGFFLALLISVAKAGRRRVPETDAR
ncbi:zona pellucida glycoprotein d isoform 1-T1 [Anableps anableps]